MILCINVNVFGISFLPWQLLPRFKAVYIPYRLIYISQEIPFRTWAKNNVTLLTVLFYLKSNRATDICS